MGVQIDTPVNNKKGSTATTVASGAASFPTGQVVSLISFPVTGDEYRAADIQRQIENCINYAFENEIMEGAPATAIAVVTSLDGGKASIRTETTITNVITGDVGILISASVRSANEHLQIRDAYKQALDWANENDRLAA